MQIFRLDFESEADLYDMTCGMSEVYIFYFQTTWEPYDYSVY
jgi:hypothetical protein